MKETILFTGKSGKVTNQDLDNAIRAIGAHDTDVLYIHTAMNFGTPTAMGKKELLESIYQVFESLAIPTLIFPTYTFSFCNGTSYDVQKTKTSMGILNDFARQKHKAVRSVDPLMSNALIGKHTEFINAIGKRSIGADSTFDLLHRTGLRVKFLFMGPRIGDCFTYMHYIEEQEGVPYRYNRKFKGEITNGDKTYTDEYELFVRYSNVYPGPGTHVYGNIMFERNIAKGKRIGDSAIAVVDEKQAYACYVELLKMSPSFYIKEVFDEADNTTEFLVKDMVAL